MIASLWGKEGTGKTSAALTFPKPMFHMELDIGGFERAAWRLPKETRIKQCEPREDISKTEWTKFDIVTKPYLVPIQMDKLLGAQEIQDSGKVTVRFPRQVVGVKELWEEIVIDFVAVCQAPPIRTIVIDSATQMWWICHTGHLQDKQEIQLAKGMKTSDDKFREKLQPVEFPNDKMRNVIYLAKSCGKTLLMTHYPKDDYAERVGPNGVESYRTGTISPDGFKGTTIIDDVVFWTYVDKNNKPYAKIDIKCALPGMGMTAVGLELPTPDYAGLLQLQSMLRGE